MKLRIIADKPFGSHVRVFDADSGVEMDFVESIEMKIEAGGPLRAKLVQGVWGGFDVIAEGKITTRRRCTYCGAGHDCEGKEDGA